MTYTYDWPQASPCSNIIMYTMNYPHVAVLTTIRDASVGAGRSLSAGGFDEVKNMFDEPNKLVDGDVETYREMYEELGEGLKEILPYDSFHQDVEYVWDFSRRVRDTQFVEKVVTRSIHVDDKDMKEILALPSTSEQKGKLLETFNLVSDTADDMRSRLKGFKYPHEVEGAVRWFQKMQNKYVPKPDYF